MAEWINTLLQGLLTGGLYALFAAGLSLSFGVMRMINIAHGDFAILAAYGAIALAGSLAMSPLGAMLAVVPLMAALGYLLQRLVLNRTLGNDVLRPLLVTFGMSILIQNLLQEAFTADSRSLHAGSFGTASLALGGNIAVGLLPLTVMATAVVSLAGMQWLFSHTALGRAFRAAADDPDIVGLMGVDNRHIYAMAMAIAMALVAVAGVFLALQTNISPSAGPARLLYAFEAVIIGGLGSLWGTLVGGIVLGLTQAVGSKFSPGWGILAGHLTFLAVLVARPAGLFPASRER
ncbi:high-affinity branched-chain amino acid transport system permease protein LivH [mine drainage metagenome]|uniref:High-affinity branched-chain amino acid transport system permease protein LivH n=1 Tax=mine drainage metagenome TaxID=410659 RepID=A0A1J5S910_9ZZZZ